MKTNAGKYVRCRQKNDWLPTTYLASLAGLLCIICLLFLPAQAGSAIWPGIDTALKARPYSLAMVFKGKKRTFWSGELVKVKTFDGKKSGGGFSSLMRICF